MSSANIVDELFGSLKSANVASQNVEVPNSYRQGMNSPNKHE